MIKPKDSEVVEYAQELLEDGTLPSNLIQALIDEFGFPPAKVRKLARKALKRYNSNDSDFGHRVTVSPYNTR